MSNRFESNAENRPQGATAEQMAGSQGPSPKLSEPAPEAENGKNHASLSKERRGRRRALISAPVRVRQLDVTNGGPDEISMTLDVSRGGILFTSAQGAFELGMEVAVTFPYSRSL